MKSFARLSLFIAVIGTVSVIHAMIDALASSAGAIENQSANSQSPQQITTAQEVPQPFSSKEADKQDITNIYQTETGNFYFFIDEQKPDSVNPQHEVSIAPAVESVFDVRVTGPIARTKVTQTFINPHNQIQDGVYVFPLPMGAAVDSLLIQVGDRKIRGEIKPKDVAENLFLTAKTEGRKASLVSQIRPDIFKNKLANIPPNEKIQIEIEYQQYLQYSDIGYELRIPTGITPRYSPNSADSRPQTNELAAYPSRVKVHLNMGLPLKNIDSLHHEIQEQQFNSVEYQINTIKKGLANKMFVLRWQMENSQDTQLAHITEYSDEQVFGIVTLLPPKVPELKLKRDLTFILDTSGSMVGESLEQAKSALSVAIDELLITDRFNIIEFDSDANALWASSNTATDANKAIAKKFLNRLEANGGTEILGALELAFESLQHRKDKNGRIKQILFITDGSVNNEEQILAMVEQHIEDVRLFSIGIGSAPNTYFMAEVANIGRGISALIGDLSSVNEETLRFLDKMKNPALTSIDIDFGDSQQQVEIVPSRLPDAYAGEPLSIFYKKKGDIIDKHEVNISAQQPSIDINGSIGMRTQTYSSDAIQASMLSGIPKQWAYEKIQHYKRKLHTTPRNTKDYEVMADITKAKVTDLAMQFKLVSDYTSLIAVEEDLKEWKNKGKHTAEAINVSNLPATSTNAKALSVSGLIILLTSGICFSIFAGKLFELFSLKRLLKLFQQVVLKT